jgi:hypothetical protein
MGDTSHSSIEVHRAKFRSWTELEDLRDRFPKATDVDDLAEKLVVYLSVALGFDASVVDALPWSQSADLLIRALDANGIFKQLPFMRYPTKAKQLPYDYEGRLFYMYAHLIAKNYGWTLDIIASLDVDEALTVVQEILIDINHQMEWEWDLSERSSGYDEQTKKSKHIPFPLPEWMNPVPQEPKKYRIPMSLIPVGNVVSYRPDAKSS